MKVDRDKRHRRILQFYLQHFRLKAPYRIIMDFEFLQHLQEKRLGNVKELFPKLFDDKAYPMVTECMVREARQNENNDRALVKFMASFERAPCDHKSKTSEECLKELLAEPRYCVAGRSKMSLKLTYDYPHVIVLMWDVVNVLVLRQPTQKARRLVETGLADRRSRTDLIEKKLTQQALDAEKQQRIDQNKEKSAKMAYIMRYHKKQVAKGPHPMSMLKKMTPEEKKKARLQTNPFREFGGAPKSETDETEEHDFLSRSKLRRKRKRMEISVLRSLINQQLEQPEDQATSSNSMELSHGQSAEQQTSASSSSVDVLAKKPRKRRKARSLSSTPTTPRETSDQSASTPAE